MEKETKTPFDEQKTHQAFLQDLYEINALLANEIKEILKKENFNCDEKHYVIHRYWEYYETTSQLLMNAKPNRGLFEHIIGDK